MLERYSKLGAVACRLGSVTVAEEYLVVLSSSIVNDWDDMSSREMYRVHV